MSIKEDFEVVSLPKEQVKEWLKHKHYAKSIPNLIYCYGLYDRNNVLVGVCAYGTPANNHNNFLGQFKCIELVRLVVNDGLERNTLSFFISQTFKMLKGPLVIISYADEGKGHHGYIYQATNWIYTGKGGGVDFYRDTNGREIHSRVMSDLRKEFPNLTRSEIADKYKWELVKGTYKFRYYYFIGKKNEKAEMKKALLEKYEILDYPKGDNERYDSSYKPATQMPMF